MRRKHHRSTGTGLFRAPARGAVRQCAACLLTCMLFICCSAAQADFSFSDNRFQGEYSTENLDRIIDAYELYDSWFWSTPAGESQTYHGHPDTPGWTYTAVTVREKSGYVSGWVGCRWMIDRVRATSPGSGGYGECFGFAQFIGYLLSGDYNPQGHWKSYYNMEKAGGLKVGDIVRVEYTYRGSPVFHSAVVYSVHGDEVLFIQASGGTFNRLSIGSGFSDGHVKNVTLVPEIAEIPGLRIIRSPGNMN